MTFYPPGCILSLKASGLKNCCFCVPAAGNEPVNSLLPVYNFGTTHVGFYNPGCWPANAFSVKKNHLRKISG